MKSHPQGSRQQKMKPMVLSLIDHSSYQLLHMINPKLHLLNSFLAFLQCVFMFALYTLPSGLHLIAVFIHVIPGLHACTSFSLDAGYKILSIVSLLLKRLLHGPDCVYYYVPTYQITLPTYVHSCVAECKEFQR